MMCKCRCSASLPQSAVGWSVIVPFHGLEVIILEYSLKLKIKHNDWLLADTCPQAANYCALF